MAVVKPKSLKERQGGKEKTEKKIEQSSTYLNECTTLSTVYGQMYSRVL